MHALSRTTAESGSREECSGSERVSSPGFLHHLDGNVDPPKNSISTYKTRRLVIVGKLRHGLSRPTGSHYYSLQLCCPRWERSLAAI